MNKSITQKQAFCHLIQGKRIRRKYWPDDNWIQYVHTGNKVTLHCNWTTPVPKGGSISDELLYGLLAWDDWEVISEV